MTLTFNQASHLMAAAISNGIPIDDWEERYNFEPRHKIRKVRKEKNETTNDRCTSPTENSQ